MEPKYLFIVGLPRTGTKLVESVLKNSRQISYRSSGETFFLGHFMNRGVRDKIKKLGDMSDDNNVSKLVDHMYSGRWPGGYWGRLKDGTLGVEKQQFLSELIKSDRGDKDIYKIILQIHAPMADNTILGDKTPSHLYHVQTLLEWFPKAKIIHTFRDPRAVLASEWRKRMERVPATYIPFKQGSPLYSFTIVLHVTVTWRYAVKLHHRYKTLYPHNYYLSKFEDMVSQPEPQVKKLCQFLEIEFEPGMLNPQRKGSSYERLGGTGFDTQTLVRWQEALSPWMQAWLMFWGKKYLREFNYIS
jgi:hypothetical protein